MRFSAPDSVEADELDCATESRYLLCMIWNTATADNDGNGSQSRKQITADQFIELQDLIERSGADRDKFLLAYGADALENFPLDKLTHAKQQLEKKAALK